MPTPEEVELESQEFTLYRAKGSGFQWTPSEQSARYNAATEALCSDCGARTQKYNLRCDECQHKHRMEQNPPIEWDGESWIYSHRLDMFFGPGADIIEELECEDELDPEVLKDLQLVLCVPQYASFDVDELFQDCREDYTAPEDVIAAGNLLEEAVKNMGPLYWSPGQQCVKTPEWVAEQYARQGE